MIHLRKLIRAIEGFGYEVYDIHISAAGKLTKTIVMVKIEETEIRSSYETSHHEIYNGCSWNTITKSEFSETINEHKKSNKVILRKRSAA